jgi:RNA polymerase sigma factor (sigma-70 family)
MDSVIKQKQLETLTNEYLKPFFAFAIKRTNNISEAEDVAQEIAYQCVIAINKDKNIIDFNAFIWSVAHNTYKRWCNRKYHNISLDENLEFYENIVDTTSIIYEQIEKSDEINEIKKNLSLLTNYYRKTMVYYYYDNLSVADIAEALDISTEMVKFYLYKGRKQIKEGYKMDTNYGAKSFNPSEFSIYYSGIDFSDGFIWQAFKRKLPSQIVLIAYEKPMTVGKFLLKQEPLQFILKMRLKFYLMRVS